MLNWWKIVHTEHHKHNKFVFDYIIIKKIHIKYKHAQFLQTTVHLQCHLFHVPKRESPSSGHLIICPISEIKWKCDKIFKCYTDHMHCFGSLVSCALHHFIKYEKLIIYQQEIKIEWAKINIMNYAKKNIGESKTF